MDSLVQSWVATSKGCVKVEKVKKASKVNWMIVRLESKEMVHRFIDAVDSVSSSNGGNRGRSIYAVSAVEADKKRGNHKNKVATVILATKKIVQRGGKLI